MIAKRTGNIKTLWYWGT